MNKIKFAYLVRDEPAHPGGPVDMKVPIADVEKVKKDGWRIKEKKEKNKAA